MRTKSRTAIIAAFATALAMLAAFAAISVASDVVAAKKKAAFTKAQKKELNKLIKSALKKKVGPTGPAGAPGAPVAPAAYSTTNGSSVAIPSNVATNTTVVSKALPAGKYVVNAAIGGSYIADAAGKDVQMACRLRVDGTSVAYQQANSSSNIFLLVASGARVNTAFARALDLPAGGTVSVTCSGGYDSPGTGSGLDINADEASLTATAVGTIG